MEYIKDNRGVAIGMLQHDYQGVQRIYALNPTRLLGWYDPASDKTICASSGSWIGHGNQVMLLLGDGL